ncbi:glycosyltransferase family 2 protein [Planctomycetes bacterium K23_9]|uniref:Undecaprenyl-phosphate 4-deoxy-4-formamido-L-arabinose transferase n=1 Tax=Stieleria marina TaxID=1930275 RepID=A0A517NSV3_9BACT|nr:Undecaprenyl-phosphate 4-deoxy-4-formamido-L-arabinose transferase [Planctomycetes bacterium K23_9]
MDESETVETLLKQVISVCQDNSLEHQVIFVDDGSQDGTWQIIERLAGEHDGTEGIRFRRNFGKAAALAAGFEAANGEIVLTMDADLQDDPKEIPKFLGKLDEGFDVVSGWKRVRHDPWHKVLPSRVFNWLVSRTTGVKLHDHNCGFKAYRREVFDQVKLYGEHHRFVPVLAASHGWKVGEIEVEHHAREFGQSKYGVSRLIKGFLDLLTIYFLTSFGRRPLHLVGSIGLGCFAAGGLGIVYLTFIRVMTHLNEDPLDDVELHKRAVFYYCILAVLLGAQLLLSGLVAELIVSLTRQSNTPFSIAQRVGREPADDSPRT